MTAARRAGGEAALTLPNERELVITIRPENLGFSEFRGTRAQIEVEGIVPTSIKWPEGVRCAWWNSGPYRFTLLRTRPDGFKGAMRLWTTGDWWKVRCELINEPGPLAREIARKSSELRRLLFEDSLAGRRARNAALIKLFMAQEDKRFQAFMAMVDTSRASSARTPRSRVVRLAGGEHE